MTDADYGGGAAPGSYRGGFHKYGGFRGAGAYKGSRGYYDGRGPTQYEVVPIVRLDPPPAEKPATTDTTLPKQVADVVKQLSFPPICGSCQKVILNFKSFLQIGYMPMGCENWKEIVVCNSKCGDMYMKQLGIERDRRFNPQSRFGPPAQQYRSDGAPVPVGYVHEGGGFPTFGAAMPGEYNPRRRYPRGRSRTRSRTRSRSPHHSRFFAFSL